MLFNSLHFLLFYPVAVALYFAAPRRLRQYLLLAASWYFYAAWEPAYLLLLVLSTWVDWRVGLSIERTEAPARRRAFLLLSLVSNLGLLFFFKYYNFANDSLRAVLEHFSLPDPLPRSDFLLPVGISFYIFQSLSYTIDVYRGALPAEPRFHTFALYVAFFPQLVAGPIERATNLLPQFAETHEFEYARAASGLRLMAWGLFKKVVIADRLALFVNPVYDDPGAWPGLTLVLATLFFGFQIYCDFSGYSDMAVGAARVMGFRIMENFRRPYFAASVADFWRRWHISLSTWFRDYLFLPLGGSRVPSGRRYANLLAVFVVSGLWHGAKWTFLAWGAIHGLCLVGLLATQAVRARVAAALGLGRLPRLALGLSVACTYGVVNLAWVFFRADTLSDALRVLGGLGAGWGGLLSPGALRAALLPEIGWRSLFLSLGSIALLLVVETFEQRTSPGEWVARAPGWVRWAGYYALVGSVLVLGVFHGTPFIYFQF
ncbi:MAG: MBOAT family protein [Planctomycetes bacterium]|nr:MBOAT family protein [Planctomycetota bacterium]